MSLSELCRLPVSNLRLSAHISAPWTRTKKKRKKKEKHRKGNKVLPESLEVDGPRQALSVPCAPAGRARWPAERNPHRSLHSRTRSCSGLCKISSPTNFYFCFLLLTWRERSAFAQPHLQPVIVGYTSFYASVFNPYQCPPIIAGADIHVTLLLRFPPRV